MKVSPVTQFFKLLYRRFATCLPLLNVSRFHSTKHLLTAFPRALTLAFLALSTAFAQVAGPDGHYYQVVLEPGITWEEARIKAAESTFNSVHGYLATITSAEEDSFIEALRQEAAPDGNGSLWIGGSQSPEAFSTTAGWFWVNGEGEIPMQNSDAGYSNWQTGEPDDSAGPQSERFLSVGHLNNFGWNDEPDGTHVQGYVIEYSGRGIAATVKVVATDPVAVEKGLIEEPPDTATFQFSREGDLSLDLPVFYSLHGTALNGFDYNEISRTILIPAGQSSVTLTIVPRPDDATVVEQMETVGIRIEPSLINTAEAAYYIDIPQREAAAVIYEGRPPAKGAIEIGLPRNGFSYKAGEAVKVLAVVYYTEPVETVDFYSGDLKIGSAARTARNSALSFFEFTWNDPSGGTHDLTARTALGGTRFTSSVITVSVQETPSITTVGIEFVESPGTELPPEIDFAPGFLEVTRTGSFSEDLQVFYSIGGTATADIDYEALQGYVVIGAGRAKARITVNAIDDFIDEPDETVIVTLVPGASIDPVADSNYAIDSSKISAQLIIVDNDDPPPLPMVSITAKTAQTREPRPNEDVTPAVFSLHRTGPTSTPLTVYVSYSGTATIGQDYLSPGEKFEFLEGQAEILCEIYAVDDNALEKVETIVVTLTPSIDVTTEYQLDPENNTATLTISDNDIALEPTVVRVHAADSEATEFPAGAEGYNPARFVLTRTGDLSQNLAVFFSLHGSARNGEDFHALPSSVIIPGGKESVEISVVPISDESSLTHHYEIIPQSGISWEAAREQAEKASYKGVNGHLATITSAEEDAAIEALRQKTGGLVLWVGGYQELAEASIAGGWKWVNDEGAIPGSNSSSGYSNWLANEPNDYWGPASENHMVIGWLSTFGWNDQGGNIGAGGYVIEYEIPASVPIQDEPMETVTLRLEPSPLAGPVSSYAISPNYRTAVALIFDHQAPAEGAIDISFPTDSAIFANRNDVEFLAAAWHPSSHIPQVDYYVNGEMIGSSTVLDVDTATSGLVVHPFKWSKASPGRFTLQAKSTLPGGSLLVSPLIEFVVEQEIANANPTVTILQPEEGAVFLLGDQIDVRAEAADPDGKIVSIDLFLDGSVVASSTSATLQTSLQKIEIGPHTIYVRATDNFGATAISSEVHILVRHPDTVSFVKRRLPSTYSPLVAFTVELHADPPDGTRAYAVEDRPPAGWNVTEMSHEGVFDGVTGKVKFGPFTDNSTRKMTYRVTPPASTSGRYEFTGEASVNRALYPITGDRTIELVQQYHPADSNQDWSIMLAEATAYAAAWKQGNSWSVGPASIPVTYVTRAGAIWKRGEAYQFDSARVPAPTCWISDTQIQRVAAITTQAVPVAVTTAERSISSQLTAGTTAQVQIIIVPATGTACHAVEEKPPRDWTISNISHNGTYDPETGIIRWGAFFDSTPRTLTYTVTPPRGVSYVGGFSGRLSFDGQLAEIGAADSAIVQGTEPIQITGSIYTNEGITLQISGPAGQTAVVESTTDFLTWTEVKSIFIPNAGIEVIDNSTSNGSHRFYRLRVQ